MSIHIAYLIQQFPPEVGAGPARATELARAWLARGARISIVTAFPTRRIPGVVTPEVHPAYRGRFSLREQWGSMDVLRSWVYPAREGGAVRTIANNLSFMVTSVANGVHRLRRPDVIIASSPPFFTHIAGFTLARMLGVPLVLELRDLWPDYLVGFGRMRRDSVGGRVLFALERMLLGGADHVVTITESFARRVEEKLVPRERITSIPNGVNTELYYPDGSCTRDPCTPFTVGYLGTFGAGQKLETVVEAAALLAQSPDPIRFVLVGDGPERRHVEQLVSARGLTNVALRPPLEKHETRAFYHYCDVCLVPHAPVAEFADTIPSKLFEIMACGRPLIAGVQGETRRVLEASDGGIVTPPGDARALADAVCHVMRMSPAERSAMGMRAHDYALAHYNRAAQADQFFDLLLRVARREQLPVTETAA